MIPRIVLNQLKNSLREGKVVVLLGARRTGKTVLLKELVNSIQQPCLLLNGEDINTIELLERRSAASYKEMLIGKKYLFIDEAQKIPEVGLKLKLIVDEIPELAVAITGSSAFDIEGNTGEPLTGRKITLKLFPLSEQEVSNNNTLEWNENLNKRLIYGGYPEVSLQPDISEKGLYLRELVNSYLLKDILSYEQIRNSAKIINLLRLLAFQVGSEVSVSELGNQLQLSRNTVEKYLDLLTKVFIIFRLDGFSRNLRKEVVKSSKWYFYDNGIMNAITANFNAINLRNDTGLLWENYMISERLKFQQYNNIISNNYFWRTYDQQEIDFVEEREGRLFAYEMKWGNKKSKVPTAWSKAYPDSFFQAITPENYTEWVIKSS